MAAGRSYHFFSKLSEQPWVFPGRACGGVSIRIEFDICHQELFLAGRPGKGFLWPLAVRCDDAAVVDIFSSTGVGNDQMNAVVHGSRTLGGTFSHVAAANIDAVGMKVVGGLEEYSRSLKHEQARYLW